MFFKILFKILTGAGESGKSTIVKQMKYVSRYDCLEVNGTSEFSLLLESEGCNGLLAAML